MEQRIYTCPILNTSHLCQMRISRIQHPFRERIKQNICCETTAEHHRAPCKEGIFILSLYIAGSKYGNIVLGEQNEKPKYSFFAWGSMMFTCGLAADILFYSFSEWVLYATDPHLAEMGSIQDWAGVYPLFHWSFIPWGFYLVLAVAFGFMLHVRKRNRQKYSEACRPILGKHTDGWAGRIIDLLAVFAML